MLPKPEIKVGELLSDNMTKVLISFKITPSLFPENPVPATRSAPKDRDSSSRPFKCPKCPGTFLSFKGMSQHMGKIHNQTGKYSRCPECNKKFKHKYAVRFHRRQVHEKSTRVYCDHCGLECYNKYALMQHSLTHK